MKEVSEKVFEEADCQKVVVRKELDWGGRATAQFHIKSGIIHQSDFFHKNEYGVLQKSWEEDDEGMMRKKELGEGDYTRTKFKIDAKSFVELDEKVEKFLNYIERVVKSARKMKTKEGDEYILF